MRAGEKEKWGWAVHLFACFKGSNNVLLKKYFWRPDCFFVPQKMPSLYCFTNGTTLKLLGTKMRGTGKNAVNARSIFAGSTCDLVTLWGIYLVTSQHLTWKDSVSLQKSKNECGLEGSLTTGKRLQEQRGQWETQLKISRRKEALGTTSTRVAAGIDARTASSS